MQNPKTIADTTGEWFEVYNATGHAIDFNGWMLRGYWHRAPPHPETAGRCGCQRTVTWCWGATPIRRATASVSVAYQYGGFTLGNTDDEIILLYGAGTEIYRVAYDGGPGFPNPDGAAMQLIQPDLDNALGANWRIAPYPWPGGAGDLAHPAKPIPMLRPNPPPLDCHDNCHATLTLTAVTPTATPPPHQPDTTPTPHPQSRNRLSYPICYTTTTVTSFRTPTATRTPHPAAHRP